MKKLTKVMLLIFTIFALVSFGLNTVRTEAKYNADLDSVNLSRNLRNEKEVQMNLRLERGNLVVDYLDSFSKVKTLGLGGYDMYGVLNEEGKVLYYIADIFEDSAYLEGNQNTKVVKAMIYNKFGLEFDKNKPMYLELTYYSLKDDNIYSTEIQLQTSDFALLTRSAINITLSDDEISDRLRASMNAESSFRAYDLPIYDLNKEEGLEFKTMNMGIQSTTHFFSNANRTVFTYSHDSYTNTDDLWKTYIPENFNNNIINGKYTDDYITRLVPKYLFFGEGVHSYIGKEYGFSVKTTKNSNYNFTVDVFLFDINIKKPLDYYMDWGRTTVEIRPQFQFRYYAKQKGTMSNAEWNSQFDPNLSEVVYKHTNYNAPNYYLKDIQIKLTSTNYIYKNPGDPGYEPYGDYGDHVAYTAYQYRGEGKLTGRTTYNISDYRIGYDMHDVANKKTNDYLLSGNLVIGHTNSYTYYTHAASRSVFTDYSGEIYQENYFDKQGSLAYFGTIAKSVILNKRTEAVSNNPDPLLIGTRTSNNHIKAMIDYSGRDIYTTKESQVHISIAADFVSDDTYYYLIFLKGGQVTVLDTMEGSYNYGSYHRKPWVVNAAGSAFEFEHTITVPGETIYVTFSPTTDSKFALETMGNLDTTMELWNTYTEEFVGFDDDSGVGLNSKIEFNGYASGVFSFKIKLYDPNKTGTVKVRLKHLPSNTFHAPGNYFGLETEFEMHVVRMYIPRDSIYRFSSLGSYETVISLFTDDGRFLISSFSHPSQVGQNGLIDWEFEGGIYVVVTITMAHYVPGSEIGFYYRDLYA